MSGQDAYWFLIVDPVRILALSSDLTIMIIFGSRLSNATGMPVWITFTYIK
jgi:hypothetical protein